MQCYTISVFFFTISIAHIKYRTKKPLHFQRFDCESWREVGIWDGGIKKVITTYPGLSRQGGAKKWFGSGPGCAPTNLPPCCQNKVFAFFTTNFVRRYILHDSFFIRPHFTEMHCLWQKIYGHEKNHLKMPVKKQYFTLYFHTVAVSHSIYFSI